MTISAPYSNGRRSAGVAKVESTPKSTFFLSADLADGFEVRDLEERVGRRLDPDEARIAPDGARHVLWIRRIDVGELQTVASEDLVEQPRYPAVNVVRAHHVVTAFQQPQHGIDRGHPGGEGDGVLASVECREAPFEHGARWIRGSGVVEALVAPHLLENIGCALEYGWHDGASARVGRDARADRFGFELHE